MNSFQSIIKNIWHHMNRSEEDPNELEKFKEIGARLKEIEGQYAEDSTYQLLLVRFLYLEGRFSSIPGTIIEELKTFSE